MTKNGKDMTKGVQLSEEAFAALMEKNKGLKINSVVGMSTEKISIDLKKTANQSESKINLLEPESSKKPARNSFKMSEVVKDNQQAIVRTTVSDIHFSLVLDGARLLSINKIFEYLQTRVKQQQLFHYKKSWHKLIHKILNETQLELRSQGKALPFFEDAVEITLFRQAPRLVDEDALTTMFKYVIDALKRNEVDNPYGILAEDNPKIVHKIECYSEKGPACIGIRIKLIEGNRKEIYNADKILKA